MSEATALSQNSILVGVSISEPSENELIQLGLSELHVRHAFIEIVRHLLARGWSVAYGGDFRRAGYTEALLDLVRTYDRRDLSGPERVFSYLAWPNWRQLTPGDRAERANLATLIDVPGPAGAPADIEAAPPDRSPKELYWGSLSLTQMRARMTADIQARVILGGRLAGQQGLYPGVLEEGWLALRAGVPLYVAGGFGGCGRALADAIAGQMVTELSTTYQQENTPRYRELLEAANDEGLVPRFEEIMSDFSSGGFASLRNGLDDHENRQLFRTDDVDEVVALVLRGLREIIDK